MGLFDEEFRSLAGYRVPFGFLVAPAIACVMVALGVEAIRAAQGGANFTLPQVISTAYFMLIFAAPFGIVIAVPAYLLLKFFWKVRLLECTVCGALIGLPFGLVGFIIGALSGVCFWVVALMGVSKPSPN